MGWGMKVSKIVHVTWPRWLPCPYMVKTFKNLLLWNHKADDLETWYAALVLKYYQMCSNDDPELTLTYFTARSNLVPFVCCMGKCLSSRFLRNYWSLWGQYSQINEYMTIYDNPRSSPFIDLCPRSIRQHFQTSFPKKSLGRMKPNFIWGVGMKICSNVTGHMTKMASRPILKKHSFFGNKSLMTLKLGISIRYSSTTKFVQIMTLGWPWQFLWHGQICFLMLLQVWKLIQLIVMYFRACSNSAYPILCTQVSDTGSMVLVVFFTKFEFYGPSRNHFEPSQS